jgi:hypothetical protein
MPLDDTNQYASSLGLQVQSVVARVNFPYEGTRGLYRTFKEQSKKLPLFSSGNLKEHGALIRLQRIYNF